MYYEFSFEKFKNNYSFLFYVIIYTYLYLQKCFHINECLKLKNNNNNLYITFIIGTYIYKTNNIKTIIKYKIGRR